jgi:hypothetical protein
MFAGFIFLLSYWQQTANYDIRAELDTDNHTLTAVEYLTYFNNSPFDIETLYCHLYANAFRDEATVFVEETKGIYSRFSKSEISEYGYINISSIFLGEFSLDFEVRGTLLIIPLQGCVQQGESACLKINFNVKVPRQSSRLGYQGDHYEMVQWYPKMCVFDDHGWHLDAYHAVGEFYGEFGSYDVLIDIPGDYVVAATGERLEIEDIQFMDSLITTRRKMTTDERRSVRFYAENVHDFAWVCDADFLVEDFEVDGIDIYIFFDRRNEKKWRDAGTYTIDAVSRYNEWFGQYPYKNLSIVDGRFSGGMEYPHLVIIGMDEDPFTRLFEVVVIHEIGHQWFYGLLGSNEIDEAWLDEGFTTYAEVRYLEDKYGKENSLLKHDIFFVPPITRRYYHKLIYYLTKTNQVEKPILTSADEYTDSPVAYANAAYSKPALFLFNLEGIIGHERFDRILKKYFETFKFKHPKTTDFIQICEDISGQDLQFLFDLFLNTTEYSDWSVKKVSGNIVIIENKGSIQIPVDVMVEAGSGLRVFRIDAKTKIDTLIMPDAAGDIKKVTIDPHGYSLEPNYWNNFYPRKVEVKPIFSLPSLDAYQIIWLPYLWYGSYDGIIVGSYFAGAEFVDYDFVKGRNQWVAGCTYGTKSNNFYPSIQYQTPIFFERGLRVRIALRGAKINGEDKASIGFINNFGIPLSEGLKLETSHMFVYRKLYSYDPVDTIDWELGTNVVIDNGLLFKYGPWNIEFGFSAAHEIFGSNWNYIKTTLTMQQELHLLLPCNIRLYAGKIFGTPPLQEHFYLSGSLRISFIPDLIGGQSGTFSPQERIHIPGDGNMRGYQTMHIKSDQMYCMNLEYPGNTPVRIFADAGYYGEFAFDAGARFVLGPFSFNCPFYASTDESWQFRWSVGF